MPNTSSAKKALKQSLTNKSRNKHFSALYKESVKNLEKSVKAGDNTESLTLLSKVYSSIDKLVKKNIIHSNNGSRRKSKFARLAKTLMLKA
ncbi:MAG: 30S ribosomal protein S20 [Candidatus Gracilibacteria bacterium]|nr:30S ribosomal protein S20 [Candidatus Gracilibacteria bacterium]MDD2908738.1 30S ribosomal protein S20 [Candidatus Gracilibacteria bacterium]